MSSLDENIKYHFYLDLDNLENEDQLNTVINLLKSENTIFNNYTVAYRMKKGTFSFHVVFYDTVFT